MENLKRKEQISWKDLGDHIIILDSGPTKMVHHLEDVASSIWKMLDGTNSLQEILKSITQEYDVSIEQAKVDINDFIESLKKNDLLE